MSPRNSRLTMGFLALLSSLATASQADTCSSGLTAALVPIISACVPAQSFCSSRYPQSEVTTTVTGSDTITYTASTSTDTQSATTTVTVTASDATATALPTTVTSSTVTISLTAVTTTTTVTTTSTDTSTSTTGSAKCPNFNGVDKRWAPTSSLPPHCRKVSLTTTSTTTTTTQDPCSSAISVLSSGAASDASTICDCFATTITETETATPTVTTVASAETTTTITVTTTLTPTDTVTPTITLYPTTTITPPPSTYTDTVTTTTTTTTSVFSFDGGEVTGSSSCGCVYEITCGFDASIDGDYNSYSSPSIQACANDCSNSNGRCQNAVFQVSNGQCTLYSGELNGGSDNADFVYIQGYYCNNGSCYT